MAQPDVSPVTIDKPAVPAKSITVQPSQICIHIVPSGPDQGKLERVRIRYRDSSGIEHQKEEQGALGLALLKTLAADLKVLLG